MSVRVFIAAEAFAAGPVTLKGDEHHYLTHVRRQGVGAAVCALDGEGHWADGEIVSIAKGETQLLLGEPQTFAPPPFSLTIAPALIKGGRMDQAITKMVELGVATIRPITTARTIVRLKGSRAQSRHERFLSLAKAAARQSRNPAPTRIAPIVSLQKLLAEEPIEGLRLIPEASGDTMPLAELLPAEPPKHGLILIGPEGGFAPDEMDAARQAGFVAASLGPRVLRAETACIAIASILSFRYGDVGSI